MRRQSISRCLRFYKTRAPAVPVSVSFFRFYEAKVPAAPAGVMVFSSLAARASTVPVGVTVILIYCGKDACGACQSLEIFS